MKAGDVVWFFEPGGCETLCEVAGPFTSDQPHDAMPTKYPRALRWPVRITKKFERISRERLGAACRSTGTHPENLRIKANGTFLTQQVYCHKLPELLARTLLKLVNG